MVSQLSIQEQMELLKRGTIEIIPEEELRSKLQRSKETGIPLKLKLPETLCVENPMRAEDTSLNLIR